MKEFENDSYTFNRGTSVKDEDQGATPSPTALPSMNNMIPQMHAEVNISPKRLTDPVSISDRYLRKKSPFSYDRAMSYSAVSQPGELPVMPYCLRQAQDWSSDGPFAPPTIGNFHPTHMFDFSTQQLLTPSVTTAPNMGVVFEAAFRSALPVDNTMHGQIAYSQCPVSENPQSHIPTSLPPYHAEENLFIPQGPTYTFPNEHLQTSWIPQEHRGPLEYN
jgi:hypothetical protein